MPFEFSNRGFGKGYKFQLELKEKSEKKLAKSRNNNLRFLFDDFLSSFDSETPRTIVVFDKNQYFLTSQ
jgi:hypothetical protein